MRRHRKTRHLSFLRKRNRKRSKSQRRPQLEQLAQRVMLAGDITALDLSPQPVNSALSVPYEAALGLNFTEAAKHSEMPSASLGLTGDAWLGSESVGAGIDVAYGPVYVVVNDTHNSAAKSTLDQDAWSASDRPDAVIEYDEGDDHGEGEGSWSGSGSGSWSGSGSGSWSGSGSGSTSGSGSGSGSGSWSGSGGGSTSGSGGGEATYVTLGNDDPSAEEPHIRYCGSVETDGSVRITASSDWAGDEVEINVGGSADYLVDYVLSATEVFTFDSNTNVLTITVPALGTNEEVVITVTAIVDDDEADSFETVQFSWASQSTSEVTFGGSGAVAITDMLENVSIYASPNTTSETTSPPGKLHIVPTVSGQSLCTPIVLEITGTATPDVDYDLQTESGVSVVLTETPAGSGTYLSDPIDIRFDTDFVVDVFAVYDTIVEGSETVVAKTVSPMTSSTATVSISDPIPGNMRLVHHDTSAEEPHLIYCGAVDETGSVRIIPPDTWPGGNVNVIVGGTATYGQQADYTLSATESFTFDSNTHVLTVSVPAAEDEVVITVTAIQDSVEADSGETVTFSWHSSQPNSTVTYVGTGLVTIADESEGINLSASPNFAWEFGGLPGTYHISAEDSGHLLCTAVFLEIDANSTGDATPGTDYELNDELNRITSLTEVAPSGSNIYRTNTFTLPGVTDYVVHVLPLMDFLHEGDETVRAKVVRSAGLIESSQETITIKEDYRDAKVIKEEDVDSDSGCNRTCPTCVCGVRLEVAQAESVMSTAKGLIQIFSDAARSLVPTAYVILPLPANKAVPDTLSVIVQAVEKDTNKLIGVARTGDATETFTLDISALNAQPGGSVLFKLQLDLRSVVDEGTPLAGQTINLELLAHPSFPTSTIDDDKFNGWVGRHSHSLADLRESGIAEAFAPGLTWGFMRWLIGQSLMIPDANGSKSDYAIEESGVTILRADGSYSWYNSIGDLPPESTSVWDGNRLTHKDGSYDEFDLATGRLIKSVDPAGNETVFNYNTQGWLSSIVDPLSRTTTIDYSGWVPSGGGYLTQPRTVTVIDPYGAQTELVWDPALDKLTVTYPDPDATGPRKALQEVYEYDGYGFLESVTKGEAGETGTQVISFSHQFDSGITSGSQGSRGLLSLTRTGAGTTTIDVTRRREALIPAGSAGVYHALLENGPRYLPAGTTELPYEYLTSITDGQGNRILYRMDHRGRVTQLFDAQQVSDLGLDILDLASPTDWTTAIGIVDSNLGFSYQYTLAPTERDRFGRVINRDLGHVMSLVEPDPDNLTHRAGLPETEQVNGPLGRSYHNFTYDDKGNMTSQDSQLMDPLSWTYDAAYSRVSEATDEHGNLLDQTIDPNTGLVTRQRYHYSGWHQYLFGRDVNQDGYVTNDDAILVLDYLNNPPAFDASDPRPFDASPVDVSNDGYWSPMDVVQILNYISFEGNANEQDAPRAAMGASTTYEYSSSAAGAPMTGLVTQMAVMTGRPTGDQVTQYQYYNTPGSAATHGQLHYVTTAVGSSLQATMELNYNSRGNVSKVTDPAGRETHYHYDSRDRLAATVYPDPDDGGPLHSPVERYDYNVFGSVIATELVNSSFEDGHLLVTSLIDGFTYDEMNRLTGQYSQDPNLTWYLNQDVSGNITRTSSKSTALAGITVTSTALEAFAAGNDRISSSNVADSDTTPANNLATCGLVQTHLYDNNSNLVKTTQYDATLANPDYRNTHITYDPMNRPVQVITPDPGGSAASVPGEARNVDPSTGEVGGYVNTFVYDNVGSSHQFTDALGNQFGTRYDQLHRPTSLLVPNPSGGTPLESTFSYASSNVGWQVTMTDPAGRETLVEQDHLGRAFRTQLPAATSGGDRPAYATGFDADGLVSGSLDPDQNSSLLDYNDQGWLAAVRETYVGDGHPLTSYLYSNDGLLQSVSDPLGRETIFSYDPGGRLVTQTAPDPDGGGPEQSSLTIYAHDGLGNVLKTLDSLGYASNVSYDARFRPTASTDPGGFETLYGYDVFGNLLSLTDARTNVTTFGYDRWDRNYVETKGTDSRTVRMDGLSNVRSATDGNGREISYEYDYLYQLTREVWLNASDQEIREFFYTYDTVGNLLNATDDHIDPATGVRTTASDTIQFVYDDLDQLQLERTVNPLVGVSTVFDRDYDLRGQRTTVATNLGGVIVDQIVSGGVADYVNQYVHDELGRLTSVSQDAQMGGNAVADKLATFGYDAASQLTDLRRYSWTAAVPGNLEVHSRYGYDGAGRLDSITHSKSEIAPGEMWNGTSSLAPSLQGGALLAGYDLQYDSANRMTEWSSYYDAFKTSFSYDTRDQLTAATHAVISGLTPPLTLPGTESYSFDGTGNRNLSGGGSTSATGTHNQVQNDGTYTYDYDNEGNQIRRTLIATGAVTDYEWDYRNRLETVTERATAGGAATSIVTFQYDLFDRRTGKQVDSDANGTIDREEAWVWDGDQVALQLVDADGDGSGAWKLANRYLYGDMVDMVLADEQLPSGGIGLGSVSSTAGTVLWPLTDHLGSIRDLVDSNGVIREHVVYDSFGNRLSESDFDASGNAIASNNPAAVDHLFGYAGREWDRDVDLQFNRARWYDPVQGRWISKDPIGFNAGDANLYRYVGNQVTSRTDPSGLQDPIQENLDYHRRVANELRATTPRWYVFKVGGDGFLGFSGRLPKWMGYMPAKTRDQAFAFGCGGVASIRGNHESAMVHLKPGARAFLVYDDAVKALAEELKRKPGKAALLIVVQTTTPLHAGRTRSNSDHVFATFSKNTNEIDPHRISQEVCVGPGDVRNWASLLSTDNGPTWEYANHAAFGHGYYSDPMRIYYRPVLPALPYNVYVVIPDSRDASPVVPGDQLPPKYRPPSYPMREDTRQRP